MSVDQPNFGALITLVDVATRGQPLAAPLPPVSNPTTSSVGGRWFAPTLASGLSREVRTLAEDPLTPSPFRDPGQARPVPGAPSTVEGNAVGDVSEPPVVIALRLFIRATQYPNGRMSRMMTLRGPPFCERASACATPLLLPLERTSLATSLSFRPTSHKTRRGAASLHLEVIVCRMDSRESHLYQTFPL